MWSPEFKREQLNLDYAPSNLSDAFQQFVGEALHVQNCGIHTFRTLGQDGAIDLAVETDGTVEVYEAKYSEQKDCFTAAKKAMRNVAAKLEENLAPINGHSTHYKPWRNKDRLIVKYSLCFSCAFYSLTERQRLQAIISESFCKLATLSHLTHLHKVAVAIVDWSDFQDILKDNPHLAMRWFDPPLPLGVELFDKAAKRARGFHAYLHSDKLSYLSPEEYHKSRSRNDAPPAREELLRQLSDNEEAGIVIVGPGGVGKTRLCEEVAKIAQKEGWTVVRVTQRLRADKLHEKRSFFTSSLSRYLLVFDYIEDQRETFREILELLADWRNDSCDVRFIGNCRRSFERTLEVMGRQVDLVHLLESSQTSGYTEWVVNRILERLDSRDQENARILAKGLPVLAVFIIYVRERFGAEHLERLLTESEFMQWIIKRMPATPSQIDTGQELALLAALLPLQDAAYSQFYSDFRVLLDCLVSDGWIVKSRGPANFEWGFVHDVFADELLAAHLRHVGAHAVFFVGLALDLAERQNAIESVLRAFERIANEPNVKSLPWADILRERLLSSKQRNLWKTLRHRLLASQLIPWVDLEILLDPEGDLWTGAERDTHFQDALGRRLAERDKEDKLSPRRLENTLSIVTRRCLQQERPSLLLIPPALKFVPNEAASAALRVAQDRSYSLQRKNHVFAALLEAGVPFEMVGREVDQWLNDHSHRVFAARLLMRCCKSDDEAGREVARKHLPQWLAKHGLKLGASHVLRAALTPTKGEKRRWRPLVEDFYTGQWLASFKDTLAARFVIEPWLRSRRRTALQCDDIVTLVLHWLSRFETHPDLTRVLGPWLFEIGYGGTTYVRRFVFPWLKEYHRANSAQYVLSGWLKAHAGREDKTDARSVRAYVEGWLIANGEADEVSFIVPKWLDAMGSEGIGLARNYVVQWLSARRWPIRTGDEKIGVSYMITSWLDAAGSEGAQAIREPVVQWFEHHSDDELTRRNVLIAWLGAVREPAGNPSQHALAELARNAVSRSLDILGPAKEASFLLRQWLRAAGPRGYGLVERFAMDWLERNGNTYEVCFVLPSMLECGGQVALACVNRWLRPWLLKNASTEDAGYVFRGALLGGLKSQFEHEIREWTCQHRHYVDSDSLKQNRIRKIVEELESLLS
jgi:hypothetical protein